jgi:hypothetical protein
MNELELDYGSRINSADEVALKRSVGPNVFEILNDGLVSEPITPTGSATFSLRIDFENVRDILLDGFGRSPLVIDVSSRAGPTSREHPASGVLLAALRRRRCPRSWDQKMRQLH